MDSNALLLKKPALAAIWPDMLYLSIFGVVTLSIATPLFQENALICVRIVVRIWHLLIERSDCELGFAAKFPLCSTCIFLGNFFSSAVSVMLEIYDADGCPAVRRRARAPPQACGSFRSCCDRCCCSAFVAGLFRFWPEERLVDKFFRCAAETGLRTAYGIYFADPAGSSIPKQHSKYPYNEFYRDWGPGGEWG